MGGDEDDFVLFGERGEAGLLFGFAPGVLLLAMLGGGEMDEVQVER